MSTVKISIKHKTICRLCLKVMKNAFTEIDVVMRQMVDILLLKLDFIISRNPIICWDCADIAKKCLKFKLTCLGTERIIFLFSANKETAKHDIKDVYKESGYVETVIADDLDICRICMVQLERSSLISFDTLRNEMAMFEMISGYLPEMDVNTINNPMICMTCRENLKCFLKFVLNCLDTEGKIIAFCNEEGTDRSGQVNLGDVLIFLFEDTLEHPDKYPATCTIKEELYTFGGTQHLGKSIKPGELEIKELDSEASSYKILSDKGLDMFDNETNSGMRIINRAECTDEKRKKNVRRDLITSTAALEADVHKYTLCTAESKLLHKDISEIKIHRCSLCAYQTKYKHCLKNHKTVIHNQPSEIKMHRCPFCAVETKLKKNLDSHMLVHKDISEIKMYQCPSCTYETKRKSNLKNHILLHKDVSELKWYKCAFCDYKAKNNTSLKGHMLVHKDVSEIEMYKCSLCAYESKYKSSLKNHMLGHKAVSEIEMHKCSLCGYESKHKNYLTKHMLVHKDVSEIEMHKCPLCAYESKRKRSLKKHMLRHHKFSQTTIQ